ncbi:Sec-independent protein translocase protein TatB [Pseudoxanthomonas suwonensis]|uniref:Sec-independent protein translocase protein TatB n=1 Tax=Pseudoxanthomonas suwonensis TaxID=314722 RepID=UPI00048F69BB|nr:Sec-independent protein translocase protein TatB [Pseudoxanthomonas suwonensis]
MFDIGFGELLLIAVVALVVLGPERLPKAARFAGLWVRRARAQWYSVKAELERELEAEELKRSVQETQAALKQAQSRLQDELGQVHTRVQEGLDSAGRQLDEVRRQVEDAAPPADAGSAPAGDPVLPALPDAGTPTPSDTEHGDEPRRS